MNRDRPCETQWDLCDFCLDLRSLLDSPARIVYDDLLTTGELDDRESLMSAYDMPD